MPEVRLIQALLGDNLQVGATYATAAILTFSIGAAILLYERLSAPSRRFFTLCSVVAAWLATLGASRLAVEPASVEFWHRHTITLQALTGPAVYALAVHLTGAPRRQLAWLAWAGGFTLAAWSLASPELRNGVQALGGPPFGTANDVVGILFVGFLIATVGGALIELVRAYRGAVVTTDRRRHLGMLVAIAVGGTTIVAFFFPAAGTGAMGMSPFTIMAAVGIMALVHTRYRTFAPDAGFAAEEVVRTMGDAVLVCDEAGVVRIANPEVVRLLGGPHKSILGRPTTDLLAWPATAGVDQVGRRLGVDELTERIRDQVTLLIPLAGPPIPVRMTVEPLRRPGVPRGWVIVARDIRERLASDEALRATEVRYRSLFWHNPAPVYEFTIDGRFMNVNPAVERLLGIPAEGLIGKPFMDIIVPEDRALAEAEFEAVMAGESREYALTVVSADGGRRSLRGVSIPVYNDDRVTGIFGVALDVTPEQDAKRELDVQRRYFEELFESSPEAIALIGEDGHIRRVNHEFTRLFGYSRSEALGRHLDDLIVPDEEREEAARLGRLAADGRLTRADLVRRRKQGGRVDVSLLARRMQFPGEEVQVYAIYRDVTDRRRTEAMLREREEELRHAQRLEAVGKLAGGIAHDFNNLLTVINGHARVLLDDLPPDDPVRHDLEAIERSGIGAAALTQQLLAFSRRQVLRPQALHLNDVVLDMERMLRRLIGSHIRLTTDLTSAPTTVLADRGQLEQVIMNLAVNARDAMPHGGILAIRTATERVRPDDPRIDSWDTPPGAYVCLEVEDDGEGMDPEVLAKAFDPFFTTKDRGKGTGLGLATVFGIVKQSGGHVSAESEPGSGTRFVIHLPAGGTQQPAPATRPIDPVTAGNAPGHTILVVEDEPSVRNLAVRVLERQGYEVLEAGDGAEALEVAAASGCPIDLLLSDLVMPGMGGRELARRMRSLRPDTVILLMSGYDDEMVAGQIAEGDDFLPKPFTPADLIGRVAQLLGARQE